MWAITVAIVVLICSTTLAGASGVSAGWKKYSINPAARMKWTNPMVGVMKKENFEVLIAGIRIQIRANPDRNVPVATRSHWKRGT